MDQYTFYAKKPIEKYHKSDLFLFISIILLWGFGLFTLFISSQNYGLRMFDDSLYFVKRQLISSLIGFVLFTMLLLMDMNFIKKILPFLVIFTLILCVLTLIPFTADEKNGAQRWIKMPFNLSFQPSELVKMVLVLYLANYFNKQEEIINPEEKTVLPCVAVFLIFFFLVLFQKDFSTSVFILVIGILLFFVSGTKMLWVLPLLIFAIPIGFLIVTLEPYRMERIIGFLNPSEGVSTFNYQTLAAKRAIGAGGFWGNGIGVGLEKLNSIPEVHADYIFAGWAEAMGFVGVVFYVILLCFFTFRGYRAAFKSPDRFASYASFGCVTVIFLQSMLNCLVTCGGLPSTGIPLPFFSLGGSSIIVTLAMCGFILNTSRFEENSEKKYKNDEINIESFTVLK